MYVRGWKASPVFSRSGTFPLYAPFLDFYLDEEDEPPWTWLRQGIPFDLTGFGYDGLHELWDGYREGLSALALLAEPPDSFFMGPDGIRTAWLESAAERHPAGNPAPHPPRRHSPGSPERGAGRDRLRGGGPG